MSYAVLSISQRNVLVPYRPDAVLFIVAGAAQPEQIPLYVIPSARAEDHVVGVDTRTDGAVLARGPRVLQPEPAEHFGISYSARRFRVHCFLVAAMKRASRASTHSRQR